MIDRRKLHRKPISVLFKVLDQEQKTFLGYVSDITSEGMNIISKKPIEPYKVYELTVLLSEKEEKNVSLNAICVWCKDEVTSFVYKTGFQILNYSRNDIDLLLAI